MIQGRIDRLNEIRRCYGTGINAEKAKITGISRAPSPLHITRVQNQAENVKYFNYLGIMINDERHTCEIKSSISIQK
jgi:hypothetical protein